MRFVFAEKLVGHGFDQRNVRFTCKAENATVEKDSQQKQTNQLEGDARTRSPTSFKKKLGLPLLYSSLQ